MPIHNPPYYRYSLYDPWDKKAFSLIKTIGKSKNYPKILGKKEDKNKFIVNLIRTQKSLHDWRSFLKDILDKVEKDCIVDTKSLNEKYSAEIISKDTPAWVTYKEDRTVSNFIDELETKRVNFIGTDEEISEFVMRFILGQLGYDWEWTIMMIWEMLGDEDKISVRKINEEMKNFDYLKLFE